MSIERLRALEKDIRESVALADAEALGVMGINRPARWADELATLIAELGQEVDAVACPKCGGKGYTDEGDPEMGSAIMDCYECWPAPVGATLADAAGDSALTLEAARELLAGAARGIARGEYSPAHTSEARDADEDGYVIEQMGRLLAEIAVIVNGPEPAMTKWSYHDLPAKVLALKEPKE